MTHEIPASRLRTLVRNMRALHRRNSQEWVRRMEGPATPAPGRRR